MTKYHNQLKHDNEQYYKYHDRTHYMKLSVDELRKVVVRLIDAGLDQEKAYEYVADAYAIDINKLKSVKE